MPLTLAVQFDHPEPLKSELDQMLSAVQDWASREMGGAWTRYDVNTLPVYVLGAGNTLTRGGGKVKFVRQGALIHLHYSFLFTTTGTPQVISIDLPNDAFILPDATQAHGFLDVGSGVYRDMQVIIYPAGYGTQPRGVPIMTFERADGVNLGAITGAIYGQISFEVSQ